MLAIVCLNMRMGCPRRATRRELAIEWRSARLGGECSSFVLRSDLWVGAAREHVRAFGITASAGWYLGVTVLKRSIRRHSAEIAAGMCLV